MKHFLQLVIILGLGWLAQQYSPWWTMALVGALAAFTFHKRRWSSFLIGLIGGGLLWFIPALLANLNNNELLSQKIGLLFGGLSPNMLLLLTALIGGLTTGLGAWTGSAGRYLIQKKQKHHDTQLNR